MAKVMLSCIGGWVSEIGIIFCLFDRRTERETIRFGEVWESNQTFGEKVVMMDEGKVIISGTPKEVLNGEKLKEVYGVDVKEFMVEALKKWK